MNSNWFELVLTIFSSVLASSGLWAYLTRRAERKDIRVQMLIGLGHDRITQLAMMYIDRGYITQDEYENLHDYLYQPYKAMGGNGWYKAMGGNGSAKRLMDEVEKLDIRSN